MDELESRLREGYDAARAEAPLSGPAVYARVRAGARRRRTVRGALTAAVAVVALGAVGIGAYGIAAANRAEPAAPLLTPSPTRGATEPPPADPTVAPTPSEAAPDPRFDDSPDGIAEDALPALAPDRGYLREPGYYGEDDDGSAYPSAYVIEDWVWDAVDEGWALDVAAVSWNVGYIDTPLPAAYLYLVSPEDVRFELFELPARMWASPRVTSWREDQGTATIWWRNVTDEHDRGAGSVVDLRTGEISDLVMAVYGETAYDYDFVMSNAPGDELWRAESAAGFKYYRWSDGADEDGWVATALVEAEPTADDGVDEIGMMGFTITEDGDRVLLRRAEDESATSMTLLTYDLGADRIEATTFDGLEAGAELQAASFLADDELMAQIGFPEDQERSRWDSYLARLELGGAGVLAREDEEDPWPDHYDEDRPYDLYYGEPAPIGANSEACGC